MHVLAVIAMSLGAADLSAAWVDRRFVIYSDPPGAQVFRNGVLIGNTPVDDHFVYYGKYQFTLVRDKCQTVQVVENISSPWYDLPGIDFVSENLVPYKIRDVRYLYYRLEPLQPVNPQELLTRAQELKQRGDSIGAAPLPRATLPPPAPPPSQMLPPPGSIPGRAAPNPFPPPLPGPSPLPQPGGGPAPTGVGPGLPGGPSPAGGGPVSVPAPGPGMQPPLPGSSPSGSGSTFVPSNLPTTGPAPSPPGTTFVPSGGALSGTAVAPSSSPLQPLQPGVAPR